VKTMDVVKRLLPIVVTFVSGFVVIAAFFSGDGVPWLHKLDKRIPEWFQIIAVFTLLIGIFNLLRLNAGKIARRVDGWGYSLVLVAGFVVMLTLGLLKGTVAPVVAGERYWHPGLNRFVTATAIESPPAREWARVVRFTDESGKPGETTPEVLRTPTLAAIDNWYNLFFNGVLKAANATILSLLAFFVASASFRAFRIKSWEAGLMLGSALVVMLGNIPLGELFSGWAAGLGIPFSLAALKEWILKVPSSAAQSAILIGAALGYVGTSLKILLGIERSHLGGGR